MTNITAALRSTLLATILVLTAGCQVGPREAASSKAGAPISHVVLAVLNDPSQSDALIRDCDTLLQPLPCVAMYACGRHIDTGRGAKVNSAYDVGLVVGFNTAADYKAYDVSPEHQGILKRWVPQIKALTIYDVADSP